MKEKRLESSVRIWENLVSKNNCSFTWCLHFLFFNYYSIPAALSKIVPCRNQPSLKRPSAFILSFFQAHSLKQQMLFAPKPSEPFAQESATKKAPNPPIPEKHATNFMRKRMTESVSPQPLFIGTPMRNTPAAKELPGFQGSPHSTSVRKFRRLF